MRSRENSCELSPEEMALFTWEGWIGVDCSIEVTSEHVLDQSRESDVVRFALR